LLKRLLALAVGLGAASKPAEAAKELLFAPATKAPPLPWPYTKLDPMETRKLGHLGYYAMECAGGTFWAIAVQLQEKIGYPWTLLPIPSRQEVMEAVKKGKHLDSMMVYGAGGVCGWASLCGALNGSIAIINMVAKNKKDMEELGRVLLRWYEVTPFPSKIMNELAVRHELLPPKLKYPGPLPQSVSHSVLCHVSVGRWCKVSGFASGSKARSERCGRLAGDVAAKAVELLNTYFEKGLEEAIKGFVLSPTTTACRKCHYKGKDYEMGQFTRGYMQCESCHTDLRAHAHEFVPDKKAMEMGFLGASAIGAIAGFVAGAATASAREPPGEKKDVE
jgi:hypothetical protein